jgi:diaminohydroxyphosphoribosylaminopyrimidine deaminase / 5-amino-6-(5-phosphoribosylamino)uracil reductase
MKYDAAAALVSLRPRAPRPDGVRPVVVAQLGQTLDGRIATVSGASKYISGREALKHLHRLRAGVDAVLVGVGTVAADDPQLTVRLVEGRSPVRVVIDPRGRMPRDARMLRDGSAPVLLVCGPDATAPDGADVLRLPLDPSGGFAPDAVVSALGARGLHRILVEGGAETLGRFLDAGRIDVLHLLVAPMILGSGKAGLSMRPIQCLSDALRPRTDVHVFDDGDVLFTCDMRPTLEAAE